MSRTPSTPPAARAAGARPQGRSSQFVTMMLGAVTVASVLGLAVMTPVGQAVLVRVTGFLEFYVGVFTLVTLTLTVIAGLVCSDRVILNSRLRVFIQSIHRLLGILAVSFLATHVALKVGGGRVTAMDAAVPFVGSGFEVGMGSVAAYLMISVCWTGVARLWFANVSRAWVWRPLHATSYLSWPIALFHGLRAGRPAAVWVIASYLLLFVFTMIALGLRLNAERVRRLQKQVGDRTTVPVGPRNVAAPKAQVRLSPASWRDSDTAEIRMWSTPLEQEPREPARTEVPTQSRVPQDDWSVEDAPSRHQDWEQDRDWVESGDWDRVQARTDLDDDRIDRQWDDERDDRDRGARRARAEWDERGDRDWGQPTARDVSYDDPVPPQRDGRRSAGDPGRRHARREQVDARDDDSSTLVDLNSRRRKRRPAGQGATPIRSRRQQPSGPDEPDDWRWGSRHREAT